MATDQHDDRDDQRDDHELLDALMAADPDGTRKLIFADPAKLTAVERQLQARLWALAPQTWRLR